MKPEFIALILTAVAWPGLGQSKLESVDVYVSDGDDSVLLLGRGTPIASQIFQKIGVRIHWHTGTLRVGQTGFGIRTTARAPESATSDALAACDLLGTPGVEITVYKDRTRRFLDDHPTLMASAAGYVLAHELAHAMQGVARHSESGIMKAHWSTNDFYEMMYHKLAFIPYDVELIHQGLAIRLAGRQSETGIPAVSNLRLPAADREIILHVSDYSGMQPASILEAQRATEASFRPAGIDVRWRGWPSTIPCEAANLPCDAPIDDVNDVNHFVVVVLPERMARKIATGPLQYGAAVVSQKGGFPTHAYVFADRVKDYAASEQAPWSGLLGVMIAHEVGHLLLGNNSHFPTGIMRGQWRTGEVKLALMGALTFTARQAEQMRSDVRRRRLRTP